MMTKETFEMVAAIVRDSKRIVKSCIDNQTVDFDEHEKTRIALEFQERQAKQFANCFQLRNPNFDSDKFLLACFDDNII